MPEGGMRGPLIDKEMTHIKKKEGGGAQDVVQKDAALCMLSYSTASANVWFASGGELVSYFSGMLRDPLRRGVRCTLCSTYLVSSPSVCMVCVCV